MDRLALIALGLALLSASACHCAVWIRRFVPGTPVTAVLGVLVFDCRSGGAGAGAWRARQQWCSLCTGILMLVVLFSLCTSSRCCLVSSWCFFLLVLTSLFGGAQSLGTFDCWRSWSVASMALVMVRCR